MSPDELRRKIAAREAPQVEAVVTELLRVLERDWHEGTVETHISAKIVESKRVADAAVRAMSAHGWRVTADYTDDPRDGAFWKFTVREAERAPDVRDHDPPWIPPAFER